MTYFFNKIDNCLFPVILLIAVTDHKMSGLTSQEKLFHKAAEFGCFRKLQNRIKFVDINSKDNSNGRSPLHKSALYGHLKATSVLIENEANIDAKDMYERTPLHLSALEGKFEVVKCLIQHGASVNLKDKGNYTPLHMAAKKGDMKIVKFLIENGALIDSTSTHNCTPLYLACKCVPGKIQVVKFLIENGAKINVKCVNSCNVDDEQVSDYTPLHIAVENGNIEIVKFLIQNGAMVDAINEKHYTPLILAIQKNEIEIVTYLLQSGAQVNEKFGIYESTPLMVAAGCCWPMKFDIVKCLVQYGAITDSKDKNSYTCGDTDLL